MTGEFSVVSLDCQRVDFRCESAFQAHASQAWMTLCVSWCRISFGDCDKGLLQCGTCARLVSGECELTYRTCFILFYSIYIYIISVTIYVTLCYTVLLITVVSAEPFFPRNQHCKKQQEPTVGTSV